MYQWHLEQWFTLVLLISSLHSALCQSSECEPNSCQAQGQADGSGSVTFQDLDKSTVDITVVRGKYICMSCLTPANESGQVEWLKNGITPYPFDFIPGQSKFHLHLLCDNRTVEIRNTQKDATGNYTCIVHGSEGTVVQRNFHVTVLGYPYEEKPKVILNKNCTDMEVKPGDDAYLFCEFCVGDKARRTDIQWFKEEEDETIPISDRSCENDQILDKQYEVTCKFGRGCFPEINPASVGKGLIIKQVTSENYGSYILKANYTLDGKIMNASVAVLLSQAPFLSQEETISIAVSLVVLFVIVTAGTVLMYNYYLPLLLYWKNRFGKTEDNDGHQYDAFLSYSDTNIDRKFAMYLKECLHEQGYQVWVRDCDATFGSTLIADEIKSMKKSRRCILIVSPDYPNSSHSGVLTELAADQTLREESRIIPILCRGISREHMQNNESLVEIVRMLPCITLRESSGFIWEVGDSAQGDRQERPEDGAAAASQNNRLPRPLSGGDGIEISVRGCGDEVQLIGLGEREKRKIMKIRQKFEKRVLLKMPPKRNSNSTA